MKKFVSIIIVFAMLLSMSVSVGAIQRSQEGLITKNITNNSTGAVAAKTSFHFKSYVNEGCIRAENKITFITGNIQASDRFFTSLIEIIYSTSGVNNGVIGTETTTKQAFDYLEEGNSVLELSHYLDAGYVYNSAKAKFYSNTDVFYSGNVYVRNVDYSSYQDEIILTNP